MSAMMALNSVSWPMRASVQTRARLPIWAVIMPMARRWPLPNTTEAGRRRAPKIFVIAFLPLLFLVQFLEIAPEAVIEIDALPPGFVARGMRAVARYQDRPYRVH